MKDYTRHTPEGLKDVLNDDVQIKQWIQKELQQLFILYGYHFVETPTFEYLDVFSLGNTSYQNKELYTWINRQGEIVALRSDQTRAIARVVANSYREAVFPQRYAYISPTFRCPKSYQGKMHEFTQAGVELVGDASRQSEVEVITLAILGIKACGIEDFTIHIGSVQLLYEMLATIDLTQSDQDAIYEAIKQKDAVSVKAILKQYKYAEEVTTVLLDLLQRAGSIELLQTIKEKLTTPVLRELLEEMEVLYKQLELFGVSKYVLFDFSILSYASYYTGIMFQGYTEGIGESIVEGGRYDSLLDHFGVQLPAVGMAVNIDLLIQKYKELQCPVPAIPKTLMVWDEEQVEKCIQMATYLRQRGECIEYALDHDYNKQLHYAKQVGIEQIIYLKKPGMVEVVCKPYEGVLKISIDAWMDSLIEGGSIWNH